MDDPHLQDKSPDDKYRLIGPVYELMSCLYSGRNIHRCKNAMLHRGHIRPGDRILVAGVGHGHDAIVAARLGAQVTVVDISATMLAQFRRTLAKKAPGLEVHTHHGDILEVDRPGHYDMVIANFFLNVFDRPTMERIFRHLVTLARPGGRIVVGDFSYPAGNPLARAFKRSYWMLAAMVFWLLASNALHPIYNYPRQMEKMGLRIHEKRHFRLLGMHCFWSILARKPGPADSPASATSEAGNMSEAGEISEAHEDRQPSLATTRSTQSRRAFSTAPVVRHHQVPDHQIPD